LGTISKLFVVRFEGYCGNLFSAHLSGILELVVRKGEKSVGRVYSGKRVRVMKIVIDKRLCKGCGICVEFCPQKILELGDEIDERGLHLPTAVRPDECKACSICELYCPDFAIAIVREEGNSQKTRRGKILHKMKPIR